mmetsp:Transcript_53816/g.60121  ORF Transcript_53816/g.60121 Transcript_53816/m.60121 type:complete len:247 (-) Transcript_53816:75-815(-)|eukprot:CAMPEP_0170852958 /NCGR_PEP_ID=MMETSP0734-20130129/12215_1 /TAXON_ID=186038 /ORGANISM="Fragilariopsis kerguelensis, Strain L26-C5" /LENGTH=246 /DNA_ID=CAMNT_0011223521 /DNA_START=221 /DNA_END=961 /DNA_ORIENTATION=-
MQFSFQFVLASTVITTASAFLVASPQTKAPSFTNTALNAADLNGWVPDESKFAFGLPGTLDPIQDFDPLGFTKNTDLQQIKAYREAETTHGRVAMLAVIGFLVTEAGPIDFYPLFDTASKDIGPAIRHLDEVRASTPFFFEILALVIGAAEFGRALKGWEKPGNEENLALKVDYFPGDIGFDPLGLKPDTWEEFSEMSTKELQQGRLAMLGIAGIVAQELVNGKEIFVNLGLAPDTFDPSSLPVKF